MKGLRFDELHVGVKSRCYDLTIETYTQTPFKAPCCRGIFAVRTSDLQCGEGHSTCSGFKRV